MILKPTSAMAFILVLGLIQSSCKSDEDKPTASKTAVSKTPVSKTDPCGVGLDIPPNEAVIAVNGVAIPCSELVKRSQVSLLHAEAKYYEKVRDLQQQSLAEMIDEMLLAQEMEGSEQKIEEFIGSHVRAEPVTQEEMLAFYKDAVENGEKLPPYEEVTSELAAFINEQKQKGALANYRGSLRAKATIEVTMPILLPPVFDVDSTGQSKGPDNAPITIVEFSDFECGYCGQVEPTIQKLLSTYGDKIRLVYRDLPLPIHPAAIKAAEATHCAQDQGKYWKMHAKLFANQRALEVTALKAYAGELELDQAKFDACLDGGGKQKVVSDSTEEANRLGIGGTPAFFVNGRLLTGAQPFERFSEIIDHELKQH